MIDIGKLPQFVYSNYLAMHHSTMHFATGHERTLTYRSLYQYWIVMLREKIERDGYKEPEGGWRQEMWGKKMRTEG